MTVKLPADNVAAPLNAVDVALDSAVLATVQGVHPGPLNCTLAFVGSKPDPLTVNVNACPSTGGLGDVLIPLTWKVTATDVTTRLREFETPDTGPFRTVTLKVPPAKIATPSNSLELLLKRASLATMHVVEILHPGPLKTTIAFAGSKPLPVIAKVNAWEPVGGPGTVVIALSCGLSVVPATANVRPLDTIPFDPFCTVTVKFPPASTAVPINCVELAPVSAVF